MLKDKLQEMAAASAAKIPPGTLAIMAQAKNDLAASGIMEGTLKVDEKIADFTLNDAGGDPVSLAELRQRGPVVISIYRGVW